MPSDTPLSELTRLRAAYSRAFRNWVDEGRRVGDDLHNALRSARRDFLFVLDEHWPDLLAAAQEAERLRAIVADLHWMSRRYADKRMTYATGLHNDRTRELLAMGVELNPGSEGLWARDGMGRAFDELSDEEAASVKDAAIDAARG